MASRPFPRGIFRRLRKCRFIARLGDDAERLNKYEGSASQSRLRAGRPVKREMDIRAEITEQFKQVALEQDKTLATLTDDLPLLDSGLDSLCFAVVVVRLENVLGADPFSTDEDVRFPVTFGDFIKFYEQAAQ